MAEETKGRIGYMTELGIEDTHVAVRGVAPSKTGAHSNPVWITPLREGEPKPGEMWQTQMGTHVEILSPVYEGVAVVRFPPDHHRFGDPIGHDVAHLSPIPTTRTVTVELTEEEAEAVRAMTSRYRDGDLLTESGKAIHKLAEALEDS